MTRHESTRRQPERLHARRTHTTTPSGRHGPLAAHHGHDPFRSATHGPMRRDYALNRFLHLTARFRRA